MLARRQYPRGPEEQVRVGPVDALLFRAGHGVAPYETRVADRRHDALFDAGDVGDDPGSLSRRSGDGRGGAGARLVGKAQRATSATAPAGTATKVAAAAGSIPDPVDGAQLEGALGFGRVLVDAAHQPAEPAQRHPDRTTDQPGADDGGPAHSPVGPVREATAGAATRATIGRASLGPSYSGPVLGPDPRAVTTRALTIRALTTRALTTRALTTRGGHRVAPGHLRDRCGAAPLGWFRRAS